jgi:hypothetical protein
MTFIQHHYYMISIGNTIVSDDIAEKFFVCDLNKCKGACCVEGDLGAPLSEEELPLLEEVYEHVKPYLSKEGIAAIENEGLYVKDYEGDYSTTTIDNRECVYAIYEKGVLKCGIEKAYLEGKVAFRKPISCHLYPIRITRYDHYDAVNYERWNICKPACSHGQGLGVPLYQFLREPLIRKYGMAWYQELSDKIGERKKH